MKSIDKVPSDPHFHKTKNGVLIECYHKCRQLLLSWQFWLGTTLGFPLEHLIWEKVWPFRLLTHWLGL